MELTTRSSAIFPSILFQLASTGKQSQGKDRKLPPAGGSGSPSALSESKRAEAPSME